MTKRQLIDEIVTINHSAEPGFLAKFDDCELDDYLRHLHLARTPRLSAEPNRYDRYFENCPTIAVHPDATCQPEEIDIAPDQAPGDQPTDVDDRLDLNISLDAYFEESFDPAGEQAQAGAQLAEVPAAHHADRGQSTVETAENSQAWLF